MDHNTTETPHSRIATGVVQVFKTGTGRGPTQARATIDGDLVTVIMHDVLTDLERSLVQRDGGKGQEGVQHLRFEVQQALREDLIAVVETETGREVIAFMSANHIDPDMALESFVLAPQSGGE